MVRGHIARTVGLGRVHHVRGYVPQPAASSRCARVRKVECNRDVVADAELLGRGLRVSSRQVYAMWQFRWLMRVSDEPSSHLRLPGAGSAQSLF